MVRVPPMLAFSFLCVAWSTSWLAIKIGFIGLDPVWSAALRFLLAGCLLTIVQLGRGIPFPRSASEWAAPILVGVVFFFGEYAPLYWGEQFLTSGLTAVLFSSTAIFAALLSWLLPRGEHPTTPQIVGTVIGIAGLVALFQDQVWGQGIRWHGPAAILVAGFAAAAGTVIIRRRRHNLHPVALNAPAMVVGGILLAVTSLLLGNRPPFLIAPAAGSRSYT